MVSCIQGVYDASGPIGSAGRVRFKWRLRAAALAGVLVVLPAGGVAFAPQSGASTTPTVTATTGVLAAPAPAVAASSVPGSITNYTDPSIINPQGITAGPDGALWFTNSSGNSIGRITTAGVVTNYTDPSIYGPRGITAGPDGALWFTNYLGDSIGRITTAGVVTNYTDPSFFAGAPLGITAGPDGALWFTNGLSIDRITTAGVITHYTDPSIGTPHGITAGPDGALWFTNDLSIGRITTAGVVTNYTDPSIYLPDAITAGPDGALWFTNGLSIGRITTAGVVTNYTDPSIGTPEGITAGPDGALWFTNYHGPGIDRITTAGVVTNYTDPSIINGGAAGITAGPDGALWFTNLAGSSIGRITTGIGSALPVLVGGSQPYGSSTPSFTTTTSPPAGDTFTGTLTCATVGNPAVTISSALPAGTYTLNGSSCSGLSLSGPTASNYQITYSDGTFTTSGSSPIRATFTYKMGSRFAAAPPGVVIYPDLVNPAMLFVDLNACASVGAVRYSWKLPAGSVPPQGPNGSPACGAAFLLPPGKQPVTLLVSDATGRTGQVTQTIDVRDLFVVSIGDSIASGEGNPDVYGVCDEPTVQVGLQERTPCSKEPLWQTQFPNVTGNDNTVCHRSTHAAASVAARLLQRPHASVTLLHVGCSGASIMQGLMKPQPAKDLHSGFSATLPPQLQQVNQARSGRPIDALVINVGADDIHFADIVHDCIANGVLGFLPGRPPDCGSPLVQSALGRKLTKDLKKLGTALDQLHYCVSGSAAHCPRGQYLGVKPDHVFIMGYHDPARGDDGSFCSGFPLTSDAWSWAENSILGPLNGLLGSKADLYGWTKVGDYNAPPYSNSFLTHGLCAHNTWVRGFKNDPTKTNLDGILGSYYIQGDRNGFIHPNQDGHLRMANSLEAAVAARLGL